jgi:hypothetical protein
MCWLSAIRILVTLSLLGRLGASRAKAGKRNLQANMRTLSLFTAILEIFCRDADFQFLCRTAIEVLDLDPMSPVQTRL